MNLGNLTYPDPYDEPESDDPHVATFRELIWYSSEVCNNCFTKIRDIGDEHTKTLETSDHRPLSAGPPLRITILDYHERTPQASQEFDPFSLPSDRFGQCYCLECGSDTRATNDDLDAETLKDRAKNIANYLREHTAASVDVREMGRALHALKAEPANQGYDSEILAAATCVGLKRSDADASGKREAVA